MRQFAKFFGLAAVVSLAACSETSGPEVTADQAGPLADRGFGFGLPAPSGAIVYVGHGINGLDLGAAEALPVDVSVNGACTLEGFEFRAFAGPLELPAGDYTVAVSLANAVTPCGNAPVIGPATITVNDGDNATIFAHLTDGGAPTASVFINDFARLGRAQIAARHAANFGAVDVVVDRGTAREIRVPDLLNGRQVSAAVQAGPRGVALEPAGTGSPVFETALGLRPGVGYYAYAVGTPGNGTFEVLLQTVQRPPVGTPADERGKRDNRNYSYDQQGERMDF